MLQTFSPNMQTNQGILDTFTPRLRLDGCIVAKLAPDVSIDAGIMARMILPFQVDAGVVDVFTVAIAVDGGVMLAFTLDAALAQVFHAYVMNAKTAGMGEYTNFPFTSLFKHPLGYFGITADGLFQLTGKKDAGVNIDADILTGISTLGTDQLKLLPEAYLEIRGGEMELTTIFNEDEEPDVYEEDFSDETRIKLQRFKLAKGADGTHVQLRLRNLNGSDFDLQSISLPYTVKTRIIGGR